MNTDTQTAIAIERAIARHLGDGSDEGEDTRQVWSHLEQDEKTELATDYICELPAIRVKELLIEAMNNGDSMQEMVETIGKRFCKENDEEWVFE